LGAGFVPEILNRDIIDEVVAVSEENAVITQIQLARREGIAAGMSSGAALYAALTLAQRDRAVGSRFVVILPDGGERYATNTVFTEIERKVR
jgi:cysteine synthase A